MRLAMSLRCRIGAQSAAARVVRSRDGRELLLPRSLLWTSVEVSSVNPGGEAFAVPLHQFPVTHVTGEGLRSRLRGITYTRSNQCDRKLNWHRGVGFVASPSLRRTSMLRHKQSQSQASAGSMPPNSSGEPWSRTDLFFSMHALEHGMSFAEVAGFLSRTEDEVREKVKELNRVRRSV